MFFEFLGLSTMFYEFLGLSTMFYEFLGLSTMFYEFLGSSTINSNKFALLLIRLSANRCKLNTFIRNVLTRFKMHKYAAN